MSKTFTVKGPFVIPVTQKTGGRIITTADAKKFCESHDFLDKEVGCYVFAFRAAKGLKPVYIGKATKSFEQEVFTEHKRNKYNEALVSRIKGTPVLFFVCLIKGKGPINKLAIDEVETFLIQAGLAANKDMAL